LNLNNLILNWQSELTERLAVIRRLC